MLFVVHQLPVTPIKPPICSATASCYKPFQSDKVSGSGKHDLFVLEKSKSKIKVFFQSIFSVNFERKYCLDQMHLCYFHGTPRIIAIVFNTKCFFFIEPFEGKQLVICLELQKYIYI